MKKVIVALCSGMVVFACNMLLPMSVLAEERACNHEYSIEVPGTYTCDCIYLECHLCGHVDYSHPLNCHNYRNYVHSANCGQ